MNKRYLNYAFVALIISLPISAERSNPVIETTPCFESGRYRNMFAEAGYTSAEIEERLQLLWTTYFEGDPGTEALYYEVSDEAYILDVNNGDVRSEGMSYGMMICVQLDKKEQFDKLWRWVRNRMYNEGGFQDGLVAWQIKPDGTEKSRHIAPDGDEYMVMALMFASARWGDGEGIMDYWSEANYMLQSALSNHPDGDNHRQDLKIYFDAVGSAPYYKISTGDKSSHGRWEHVVVPINPTINVGNMFKLFFCVRTRNANYYIDNVRLRMREGVLACEKKTDLIDKIQQQGNYVVIGDRAEQIQLLTMDGIILSESSNSNRVIIPHIMYPTKVVVSVRVGNKFYSYPILLR